MKTRVHVLVFLVLMCVVLRAIKPDSCIYNSWMASKNEKNLESDNSNRAPSSAVRAITCSQAIMNRSLQVSALIVLFLGLVSFFSSRLNLNQLEALSSNEQTRPKNATLIRQPQQQQVYSPIFSNRTDHVYAYQPSVLEDFVMNRLDELGFNQSFSFICNMWRNDTAYSEIATEIKLFEQQLQEYATASRDFQRTTSSHMSIVKEITKIYQDGKGLLSWDDASMQVCETLRIHSPLTNNASKLLSHSSRVGFLEPLLPPMRHPGWCTVSNLDNQLNLGYLVHDFYTMCRNIKPTSRIILVDMGASLDFHSGDGPPIYLISKFRQFGFYFDHIYAFEATPQDPNVVYQHVPNDWVPAYHWMNIPVQPNMTTSYLNPLRMILHEFDEDDLVLVKLDIDTPELELNLVYQLLSQENDDEGHKLSRLIDHFYFEHHVTAEEMRYSWGEAANGTVKESLILFQTLRKNGIASHYWV